MSYVSEKPVSPKSGTLKSPPKGFDTSAINKSYYNVVSDLFFPCELLHTVECHLTECSYLHKKRQSCQEVPKLDRGIGGFSYKQDHY